MAQIQHVILHIQVSVLLEFAIKNVSGDMYVTVLNNVMIKHYLMKCTKDVLIIVLNYLINLLNTQVNKK